MEKEEIIISIAGKTASLSTGEIARQANGSVWLRAGNTVVLATVCMGDPVDNIGMLPLVVDCQSRLSSGGRTSSGFIKRDGKPSERDIISSRIIDRSIRPMLEDGYCNDTHIMVQIFSFDERFPYDPLAICAASAAVAISEVPMATPVAAVQIGMVEGKYVINPTLGELEESALDMIMTGTEDSVTMIEGSCKFLSEDEVVGAIEFGHGYIQQICQQLAGWQKSIGKDKSHSSIKKLPDGLGSDIESVVYKSINRPFRASNKKQVSEIISTAKETVRTELLCNGNESKYTPDEVWFAFDASMKNLLRRDLVDSGIRIDGRSSSEVRQIHIKPDILPENVHGSVFFTRGETSVLAVCTLGGDSMGQKYETLECSNGTKFRYSHYFFPPYSVGEKGRVGPPKRREVGHGRLTELALHWAIPSREQFPYTIRMESNVTDSNGSSSMASVCGCALCMLSAGVPLKKMVAGIAMGIVIEGNGRFTVLSDITGLEDHFGDMDLKVAGDGESISAFQLDVKTNGLSTVMLRAAAGQAMEGIRTILTKMRQAYPNNKGLSPFVPKIKVMKIKPEQIGTIIGGGGKTIRNIMEKSGATVDIDDNGNVSVTSIDENSIDTALSMIKDMTTEIQIGSEYDGSITSVTDYGLFVKFCNCEGLCHISEISDKRISNLQSMYNKGDPIKVKVVGIKSDERTKKKLIQLSYRKTKGWQDPY